MLFRSSLVLVVGAEHKWASRRRVEPSDLASSEWVLREAGSGTRSVFEAALLKAGLSLSDLTIAMELPSNDAVRAAVEAGMGATVTSVSGAAPSIEAGVLHQVGLELPDRPFFVLKHRERYLSQAAKAFLALMEQTTTPRKQARIAKSQPKPRKHSKQI